MCINVHYFYLRTDFKRIFGMNQVIHHHYCHHYHKVRAFSAVLAIRVSRLRRKANNRWKQTPVRFEGWSVLHANPCIYLCSFKYVQSEPTFLTLSTRPAGKPNQESSLMRFQASPHHFRVTPIKLVWFPNGQKIRQGHVSYLVNCRSFASMLRCLIHILVSAEPMSLVAPGNTGEPGSYGKTNTGTLRHTERHYF